MSDLPFPAMTEAEVAKKLLDLTRSGSLKWESAFLQGAEHGGSYYPHRYKTCNEYFKAYVCHEGFIQVVATDNPNNELFIDASTTDSAQLLLNYLDSCAKEQEELRKHISRRNILARVEQFEKIVKAAAERTEDHAED